MEGLKKPKTVLFDCPGYGDTFGCYRVLSNGYFHYRVFSKVKNVKFIFTFPFGDLDGTASMVASAFKDFISGFDSFDKIKEEIIAATSFMVTKVPRNYDLAAVRRTVSSIELRTTNRRLNNNYLEFRDQMIRNNKIFILHQAEVGRLCNDKNSVLAEIDKSCEFWNRE